MKPYSKFWRDSASLLVLARSTAKPIVRDEFNYKILVLKRTSKSSFMPNAVVFPGGNIERSDCATDWLNLYKTLGITDSRLKEVSKVQGNRSFIHEKEQQTDIEREISLRITAIRETFEEVGLLICKNSEQFSDEKNNFSNCLISGFDVKLWQKEIHNDHTKFLTLCQELKVAPDIWGSYEWANWLTPTTVGPHRFNTAFFLVALNEQPKVFTEENEVHSSVWATSQNLLEDNRNKKIWLPPPQSYELSKLSYVNDIDKVASFARMRNKLGTTLIFPVSYKLADDQLLHVLPGDDLYPKEPNYFKTDHNFKQFVDKTCEEMMAIATKTHRSEQKNFELSKLYLNFPSFNGHLCPLGNNNHISKL